MRSRLVCGEDSWGFEVPRVILGRSAGSDIRVSDTGASRLHADLRLNENEMYMVVDRGSRNGTYLNDQLVVGPTLLKNQDVIRIGQQEFRFEGNVEEDGSEMQSQDIIGRAQSQGEETYPVTMLSVCLVQNEEALGTEPLVQSCSVGEWFLKQEKVIRDAGGVFDKVDKNFHFSFWSEEQVGTKECLNIALSCAKECVKLTNDVEREFLEAGMGDGNTPLFKAYAAIHTGGVCVKSLGTAEVAHQTVTGEEVSVCSDLSLHGTGSAAGIVCIEKVANLLGGMTQPYTMAEVGPRRQAVLLYQIMP